MNAGPGEDDMPRRAELALANRSGEGSLQKRLRETARRARRYFESARAPANVRAYASDLADFETWCAVDAGGLSTLPASPETVALYIADLAGRGMKASTITRRLTAISVLHKSAGLDSPAADERVKDVLKGIRREHGSYQEGAAPLLTPTIKRMILAMRESAQTEAQKKAAVRDAALLLIGYAGAFRRSEISSLRIEDVEFVEDGARLLLRRSKTDQAGSGRVRGIAHGGHRRPAR